jgi:hypothetical protein
MDTKQTPWGVFMNWYAHMTENSTRLAMLVSEGDRAELSEEFADESLVGEAFASAAKGETAMVDDSLVTSAPACGALAPIYGQLSHECLAHESYLHLVRHVLVARLNAEERIKALETELFYGAGRPNAFGVCFYNRWNREQTHHVIEISAFNEESVQQLWETLAHELGHAVAGYEAGHGPEWRKAARRLGLRRPKASGPAGIEDLDPKITELLNQIPLPEDGSPVTRSAPVPQVSGSTCPLGIGTQGGTSRGPGSGSRLRLYMCECERPRTARVRVASDDFRARCLVCGSVFERVPDRSSDASDNAPGNNVSTAGGSCKGDE